MRPVPEPLDGPVVEATRTVLSRLSATGAPATLGPPVDATLAGSDAGVPDRLRVWPLAILPEQHLRNSLRPDGLRFRLRYLITSDGPVDTLASCLDRVLVGAAHDGDLSLVPEPISTETWLSLGVRPRAALVVEIPICVARPSTPAPLVRGPLTVDSAAMVTLTGRVLGPAGVPVPGVRVTAAGIGTWARTGGDGAFLLPGLPAGTVRLLVTGKGLRFHTEVAASAEPVVLHCEFEED